MTDSACEEMRLLVQAELDGELDAAGAAALAAHLSGCPGCTALAARLRALSMRVRREATRHPAPRALVRAVTPHAAGWRRRVVGRAGLFGAGMAAAVLLMLVLPPRPGPQPDGGALVAAHIRALQPGHLLDIASSDQHTVKPWFDGKLDYAPPVRDLAQQGFPLLGARLDVQDGRSVAALVYGRDRHVIDLFVWPGTSAGTATPHGGYGIIGWARNGMQFRAVSDLNPAELRDFATLMQQADR